MSAPKIFGEWKAIVGNHPSLAPRGPARGRYLFPHIEIPQQDGHIDKMTMHASCDDTLEGCDAYAELVARAVNSHADLVAALAALLALTPEDRLGVGTFDRKACSARNTAADAARSALAKAQATPGKPA